MFSRTSVLLCTLLLSACGAPEPSEAREEPTLTQESPAEPEEELDDLPEDEPNEEELVDEESVDDMDERDLEAACFAGRQAACDRLGH